MLNIPRVSAASLAVFARKIVSSGDYNALPADEKAEIEAAAEAASLYVSNYTGLPREPAPSAGSGSEETVENGDLLYAVMAIGAEMIDCHQVTAQYTGRNPTVMQIMDMHSCNLLPSVPVE